MSQLVIKIYIDPKYSVAFPVKSFFKETITEKKDVWICSSQHDNDQCNKRKEIDIFCNYCRYMFNIWYLFDISQCRLTWGSRKQPLEKSEFIKWSTTEPPHYMSHYTYKLSQFIETPTKQTMITAEDAVLTKALTLLPPVLIYRRIPKCFDTAVWHFFEF